MLTCESRPKRKESTLTFDYSYTGFVRGDDPTPRASNALFKENRLRLIEKLRASNPRSVVLLQGGSLIYQYDSSVAYEFIQEPFFYWLFGVVEPDFYGVLDVRSARVVLFVNKSEEQDNVSVSSGCLLDFELIRNKYEVDEIRNFGDICEVIKELQAESVLLLGGNNPDTGQEVNSAKFLNNCNYNTNTSLLYPIMANLRAIKTKEEIRTIKRASLITSEALKYIMLRIKAGNYEYQADAIFKHFCYFSSGCRLSTLRGICASGSNIIDINYSGPMHRLIDKNDLCLLDMGVKYCGYASKATVTYPVCGELKIKEKDIYLVVQSVWKKVLAFIKAGVSCVDLQIYAHHVLLKNLRNLGVVQGDIKKMLCAGMGYLFAPYSIIDLIGVEYFDVGGYIDEETPGRPSESWLSFMKTTRKLEKNMTLTFTPCCYFIKEKIEKFLEDQETVNMICKDKIDYYLSVGGIKFEDTILVKQDNYELLTNLPRTVTDLEKWLKQPVELYLSKVMNETLFSQVSYKLNENEKA
ncbi:hypothetical protein O3M35_013135 [Rhynocoris fuscipes]|uniref:Xaa-Pro dipeptidase n=1 Tax=Rhynocoris fuscipes TaxID=488301 RepID=A0AAW1CK48_9HEMI